MVDDNTYAIINNYDVDENSKDFNHGFTLNNFFEISDSDDNEYIRNSYNVLNEEYRVQNYRNNHMTQFRSQENANQNISQNHHDINDLIKSNCSQDIQMQQQDIEIQFINYNETLNANPPLNNNSEGNNPIKLVEYTIYLQPSKQNTKIKIKVENKFIKKVIINYSDDCEDKLIGQLKYIKTSIYFLNKIQS